MDPRETATRIVNQALKHEDAIEINISVATLLIGIEAEIKRAIERKANTTGK